MNRVTSRRLRRLFLGAAAAALLLTTATALAGSGVGGVFNLGQTNTVGATSTLSGETAAPQLTLKNTSTNTSATALNLSVAAGRTPFKVNSAIKVASLNADLVDGRDSTYFLAKGSKAADADKLDGIDSTGFWKAGGNAGTTPGTDFLGTTDDKALELKVNGERALRIEPKGVYSPNLIGGSAANTVDAPQLGSVIAGGGGSFPGGANHVENSYDFIGAGYGNMASGSAATVAGGQSNTASGFNSAVAGGQSNTASGSTSAVGGGVLNTAGGDYSTIAGGYGNSASYTSAVGGGYTNSASGDYSTIAGGGFNTASGNYSTVAGGFTNTASGIASFAAGGRVKADDDGAFIWGDSQEVNLTPSPGMNTFSVRAGGGIWLGTTSSPSIPDNHFLETTTGGYLSSAGVWTDASDRALKHDFRPLDTRSVLEKVAWMPITSWSYKAEKPGIRHIGPMAQDFYKAFGLGLDDKHIGTIDEGGVALAAIQGLYGQNQALQGQNRTLGAKVRHVQLENASLKAQLKAQNARLSKLERAIAHGTRRTP
jgi:hypothetical protein